MDYQDISIAIADDTLEPRVEGIYIDSMDGKNPVYVAKAEENELHFINSSNQEPLSNFDSLFVEIQERLEEEDMEGEVTDPTTGNQIYWEVLPIGTRGSLIK